MSIRIRLTLWYAVILAAALGLFGTLAWIAMRQRLFSELDRDLRERGARFENYLKAELAEGIPQREVRDELNEFCAGLPSSSYVSTTSQNGFVFRFPANAARPGNEYRWFRGSLEASGEKFDFEVGAPETDVRHTLDLLALLLWSLLPVVIAIACIGGWWLSGRALKPVEDLTSAARAINAEDLSARLPTPATRDELARLTEVLNAMLSRIDAAVRTLSQFAADASHELRTPLSVIRTTADLALRRERSAESYRESLREVAEEAARMTSLIDDLLALARSDTGSVEMPVAPVDLADTLHKVASEMRPVADLRGVQVSLETENCVVLGNGAALHRLFLLLLDNAIKFSHPGAEVSITCRAAEVAIQDSGCGIAASDLPHIFERFYRADRSRTSPGHGLGLALADRIVRSHAAEISVETVEGQGSTFRVRFSRVVGRSANLQLGRVPSST